MSLVSDPRVELIACNALVPNPANARTHTTKRIAQIASSIERFGFLVPIVVDDADMTAAGHGRWEAAGQLGLDQVPVVRAKFLSEADRRAFALAENRIAELSDGRQPGALTRSKLIRWAGLPLCWQQQRVSLGFS